MGGLGQDLQGKAEWQKKERHQRGSARVGGVWVQDQKKPPHLHQASATPLTGNVMSALLPLLASSASPPAVKNPILLGTGFLSAALPDSKVSLKAYSYKRH